MNNFQFGSFYISAMNMTLVSTKVRGNKTLGAMANHCLLVQAMIPLGRSNIFGLF